MFSFSNLGLGSSRLYPWYSSSLRRLVSAVSAGRCIRRDCVDDVGCADEVEGAIGAVSSAGGTAASCSNDAFASGLSLSFFSDRRLDFLTEWIVDTFQRWDTFLPFFEVLVSFFQMSALGAASTDMLLSLPMLLSESSSKSLACLRLGVLVCTRCTFPTNRCDLTNLTLFPLPSLSEDLSGSVAGFDVNPCSWIKWAFLSSADAKVLPQFFS